MVNKMRVLVAHPARQHSYQLASALKRAGMLGGYATTVYNADRSFTRLVTKVLPARYRFKAAARVCSELDSNEVHQFCEISGLAVLFCLNIPFMRRWYWRVKRNVEDRFAKKVARFAIEEGFDAVVSYDGTSPLLFEKLKGEAPRIVRILDMSAANALYLRFVYETDFEIKPDFEEKLKGEWKRVWDPVDVDRTKRELASADFFLCGSKFVKRSLEYSGVDSCRCAICHYGVDTDVFSFVEREEKDSEEALNFIYIGGTNEFKGIGYLLDAFETLDPRKARLTVVGQNNLPRDLAERYASKVELTGLIPHKNVSDKLAEADVMLFPSLGDGFSLAVMEALSCGVPVVCSSNTGAADIIRDGENGFVIPPQDQEALNSSIEWFCNSRHLIPAMAKQARASAENCTWDQYARSVSRAVAEFCLIHERGQADG